MNDDTDQLNENEYFIKWLYGGTLPQYSSLIDLLMEVLVSLFQMKEDFLSTFGWRSTGYSVVDASQKLLKQRLQLHLVFNWQLRHVYSWIEKSGLFIRFKMC